jgi:hypothetical protein
MLAMDQPVNPHRMKARDVSPTGVRLPPSLREDLLRQAAINNCSLSQEITRRLLESLRGPQGQPLATYRAAEPAPAGATPPLGDHQRMLLAYFNAMPPDRQLALLAVLRR